MEVEVVKVGTLYVATAVEACAGLIIAAAAVEGMIGAVRLMAWDRGAPAEAKDQLRLRLGRWLAVALEFELAADILRTAVAPTWNEIGQLAAIIVLRTLLNYFLQKEIAESARRSAESPNAGETALPKPSAGA